MKHPRWWTPLSASIIAASLAFIALGSWSVASPIGSSPDDDYHLASIWCGLGEREGICEAGAAADERLVPERVAGSSVCTARQPEQSAACEFAPDSELIMTNRGDFADNLYPPVFYATMSLFVGPDVAVSTIVMRLVNAAIYIGMLTASITLLPAARRRTIATAAVITVVPLGMFIIASVNPSSWAISSAASLWILLLAYIDAEPSSRRRLLGTLAIVAAVIGAGARADAAVYNGVAVAAALIASERGLRMTARAWSVPIVIAAVSLLSFFSSAQSQGDLAGQTADWEPLQYVLLVTRNLAQLPNLWAGVFGTTALGWLDTAMPASVWVLSLAVVSGVVFVGLATMNRRKAWAIGFVAACLMVIPLVILTRGQILLPSYVQPRYFLPLIIMIVGISIMSVAGRELRLSLPQSTVVIVFLSIANAFALGVTIRRYVTGVDALGVNLDSGVEWWWAGPVSPMAVWTIGAVSFTAALIALFFLDRLTASPQVLTRPAVVPIA